MDADYPYNKDDISTSSILITSKYATPSTDNKLPQIIVAQTGYNTSTMSFFNNFQNEIQSPIGAVGTVTGARSGLIISFVATIDVISTVKKEAEIIADKCFNALTSTYVWVFDLGSGIHVRSVQVGEAIPKQQYPQYEFIATVTLQGDFNYNWTAYAEPNKEHILKNLKTNLTLDLSKIDP